MDVTPAVNTQKFKLIKDENWKMCAKSEFSYPFFVPKPFDEIQNSLSYDILHNTSQFHIHFYVLFYFYTH